MSKRLAVLVSGEGTIKDAIVAAGIPIALVLADRECRALATANDQDIPTVPVPRAEYASGKRFHRREFTQRIENHLSEEGIELVMMAGFMSILHPEIFTRYARKIINTHPSLLPAFPGRDAVGDAWRFNVKITGCTMHYATPRLDHGPIIDQRSVRRRTNDTIESLRERIKKKERKMVVKNLRELMLK